jgi:hypothetical protein
MDSSTFMTNFDQDTDSHLISSPQSRRDRELEEAVLSNDYIKINALSTQFLRYDVSEKHQRASNFNTVDGMKRNEFNQRRVEDEFEKRKFRMFLIHKNHILK